MASKKIIDLKVIREEHRLDGGTDFLTRLLMSDGKILWVALRIGEQNIAVVPKNVNHDTARFKSTCIRSAAPNVKMVQIPKKRTFRASIKLLLADLRYAFSEDDRLIYQSFYLLNEDDRLRREREQNLRRTWRIHELITPITNDKNDLSFLVRLSCNKTSHYSAGYDQFVLEAKLLGGQICICTVDAHGAGDYDYDKKTILGIKNALLFGRQYDLQSALVDLNRGLRNAFDAELIFKKKRENLLGEYKYQQGERANSVRQIGKDITSSISVEYCYESFRSLAYIIRHDESRTVMTVNKHMASDRTAKLIGVPNNYAELIFTTPIETARRLLGYGKSYKTKDEARRQISELAEKDFRNLLLNSTNANFSICETAILDGEELCIFYAALPGETGKLPPAFPRPIYRIRKLTPTKNTAGMVTGITSISLPTGKDCTSILRSDELTSYQNLLKLTENNFCNYDSAIRYLQSTDYLSDPGYPFLNDAMDAWELITESAIKRTIDGLVCNVPGTLLQKMSDMKFSRNLEKVRKGVEESIWGQADITTMMENYKRENFLPAELVMCIDEYWKSHQPPATQLLEVHRSKKRGRPAKTWNSDEEKVSARKAAKAAWAREARSSGRIKEDKDKVAARQKAWRERHKPSGADSE
ncbi:hypothetical protein [Pseudomonas sp. LS-2]|uniref:hypothetical protein n=1 Tax=Pseudomonas sp. LS-2 TaxID=2315859 RepID=UPI000E7690D1|nr:hypothetical protein [Pseudomonas sp. LS-2]RJX72661.1 hypothetical protein D3M70_31160 [Pseudomonas sp. LS-2]